MKRSSLLALAVGVVAVSSPAVAQTAPCGTRSTLSVVVCVNGAGYAFTDFSTRSDGTFSLARTTVDLGGGASFSVQVNGDQDPFTNFTFGSILPSTFGPLTFDVYFSNPFTGGPYNAVSTTGGITVSAAVIGTVGVVSAGAYPAYLSGYLNAVNAGVDIGTAPCSAAAPTSTTCTLPTGTGTIAPVTGPGVMAARLSYKHTTTPPLSGGPGSSTVGITGAFTLTASATAVPEPATVTLTATGLLLLVAAARRSYRPTPTDDGE